MDKIFAVVMAGGRGARFWPRSRRTLPKQCLSVDGGPTLIQQTVRRLQPLVDPERVLVITGRDMVASIREQLPEVPAENVLVEPQGRNTAPCVGLGAVEVMRRGGEDAVFMCLPADHIVQSPEVLREALGAAVAAARSEGALVTIGISPSRAETGYGYLELGPVVTSGPPEVRSVRRFREKPDAETAKTYLADGRHLWNAGMFLFRVDALRDAFRQLLPATAEVLAEVQRRPERLGALWVDD